MNQCPCGSGKQYEECCERLHKREEHAATAEALMRARYAAYVKSEIDFLVSTVPPLDRKTFDRKHAKDWADRSQWLGLEVVSTKAGVVGDKRGTVEFRAKYRQGEKEYCHHEISKFELINNRWMFIDGRVIQEQASEEQVVSRNAPCPCGSGKKYKKCCAA